MTVKVIDEITNDTTAVEKKIANPEQSGIAKKCTDHLGNEFQSVAKMGEYWGVKDCTIIKRLKNGWSLEEALTIPAKKGQCLRGKISLNKCPCTDHLGNKFDCKAKMLKHWGVSRGTFDARMNLGWDLEKALTLPTNEQTVCYDHLGNKYTNKDEMAKAYGISKRRLKARIQRGWSIEETLCYERILSIGEQRIAEVLKDKKITFFNDKTLKTIFSELGMEKEYSSFVEVFRYGLAKQGINYTKKAISKMRPDFALVEDENIHSFIEFDGEQHFKYSHLFFKTLEKFIKRCDKDQLKNNFAETAGIPLLRIRYDQLDKVEYMVDDFLKNPVKYLTQHNTFLTEEEYWEPLKKENEKLGLDELASAF